MPICNTHNARLVPHAGNLREKFRWVTQVAGESDQNFNTVLLLQALQDTLALLHLRLQTPHTVLKLPPRGAQGLMAADDGHDPRVGAVVQVRWRGFRQFKASHSYWRVKGGDEIRLLGVRGQF